MARPQLGFGAPTARAPALVLTLALACEGSGAEGEDRSRSEATDSEQGSSEIDAVETGEDQLPPIPTLLSPSDGATQVPLETELCWTPVEDPEGEPLRYRLYIDDTSLTEGRLGDEDGYAGPCVGPLLFAHEREYTWQVEAFEVDEPARGSGKSELWRFSTVGDGLSETVFEDDFEAELG